MRKDEKEKIILGYIEKLQISREEAEELFACDFENEINEEAEKLNEKASKVKIDHDACGNVGKSTRKVRTCKISDEKTEFFQKICEFLKENGENYQISKENKLIFVEKGGKFFKIDLIESRTPLF